MSQDFNSSNWINEEIDLYLKKADLHPFEDNLEIPEDLLVYKRFHLNASDISITVFQSKLSPYKIDLGSVIRLSDEHIDAYINSTIEDRNKLKTDIYMWLTPRKPQFVLNFDIEKELLDDNKPGYLVFLPIYEGDLSFAKFLETIDLVAKSANLARTLIQANLNPKIKKNQASAKEYDEYDD